MRQNKNVHTPRSLHTSEPKSQVAYFHTSWLYEYLTGFIVVIDLYRAVHVSAAY